MHRAQIAVDMRSIDVPVLAFGNPKDGVVDFKSMARNVKQMPKGTFQVATRPDQGTVVYYRLNALKTVNAQKRNNFSDCALDLVDLSHCHSTGRPLGRRLTTWLPSLVGDH